MINSCYVVLGIGAHSLPLRYGMISYLLIIFVETPDTLALKAKRQLSLTSDTSDISDESEVPLTVGLPQTTCPNGVVSNGNIPTSPTGSESTRFHFSTAHSQIGRQQSKPLVSRQETNNSMRSHSSRVS